MAIHRFGEAFDNEVGTVVERTADGGAGQRVIDEQLGAVSVCDFRETGKIRDVERGIGNRFDDDEACGVGARGGERGRVGGVELGRSDAKSGEFGGKERRRASIEGMGNGSVVAGTERGEGGGGEGGHSGGGNHGVDVDGRTVGGGVVSATGFGELIGVGVAIAAIDVAGEFAAEEAVGLVGITTRSDGRGLDGRSHGPPRRAWVVGGR